MGSSHSRINNTLKNFVNSYISVLNSSMLSASSYQSQIQSIEIINTKGDVNINDINWDQTIITDLAAFQTAIASSDVKNEIDQLIKQTATQIDQAFSFKIGDDKTINNLIENITNLSTVIQNQYTTTCYDDARQSQSITVRDTDKNVTVSMIYWTQLKRSTMKCIQNSDTTNAAINNIIQKMVQDGTQITENPFDFLAKMLQALGMWIVPIILGGVYLFVKLSGKGLDIISDPKKVIGVAMFIGVVFGLSMYAKKKREEREDEEDMKRKRECLENPKACAIPDCDTKEMCLKTQKYCDDIKCDEKVEKEKCDKTKNDALDVFKRCAEKQFNDCSKQQKAYDDIKCDGKFCVISDLCKNLKCDDFKCNEGDNDKKVTFSSDHQYPPLVDKIVRNQFLTPVTVNFDRRVPTLNYTNELDLSSIPTIEVSKSLLLEDPVEYLVSLTITPNGRVPTINFG